jgi:hypothetical protein
MCSVTKPLPNNLQLKYFKKNIEIYEGDEDVVINTNIISRETGSRSFVYKIMCNGSKGLFPVVAKVQKSKGERLEGLKYEKMVYSLMTKLVDTGVCPFRLRSYDMFEPENILVTETFENMIDLGDFLDNFHHSSAYHIDDCYNILIQILYAIEVNYRVGIRHNDLHVHNVMILFCPTRQTKKINYLNRNKIERRSIFMYNCSFMIKFFDNDRVTKLGAKNKNVNSVYQKDYDPKPVLNLFPWHEPAVYTEKLDLFKIMQHIRDDSQSPILNRLVESLNVSFSKSEKKKKSLLHGTKNFMRYHLVTDPNIRKEPLARKCSVAKPGDACAMGNITSNTEFPKWLDDFNSSEKALMILLKSQPRSKFNKPVLIGDISKLYVKMNLN